MCGPRSSPGAASACRSSESQGCPEDVCRAGMFHSIHGTERFQGFTLSLGRRDEDWHRRRVAYRCMAERLGRPATQEYERVFVVSQLTHKQPECPLLRGTTMPKSTQPLV